MIRLRGVSKVYRTSHGPHVVLDEVDLTIRRGEKLGILGHNGAGKSTLIRLMSGAEMPTDGQIERQMTISWPLAFSGGFQGSLTGLDNLRFICRVYDTPIEPAIAFVEDFAELGKFLREPMRSYSAGMCARLAFALSMAIDFDCFLIDEVVAVGDQRFHERCRHELFVKRRDRAMVVVSHQAEYIRQTCERACVLHRGRLHAFSSVDAAMRFYEASSQERRPGAEMPSGDAQRPAAASAATTPETAIGTSGRHPDSDLPDDRAREARDGVSEADCRAIVQALYRAMLCRDADPSGLQVHADVIQSRGKRAGTGAVIQAIKGSAEYAARRVAMSQGGRNRALEQSR